MSHFLEALGFNSNEPNVNECPGCEDEENAAHAYDCPRRVTNPNIRWEFAGNWAVLPMHIMNVQTHRCVFCLERPIWDTYEEYLFHFWTEEYEGEPYHVPSEREEFDILFSLCNAVN